VVVAQQSTQPLAAFYDAATVRLKVRLDNFVSEALMVPLQAVVLAEMMDRPPQGSLSDQRVKGAQRKGVWTKYLQSQPDPFPHQTRSRIDCARRSETNPFKGSVTRKTELILSPGVRFLPAS
jgi:hypothetical protein